MGGTKSNSPNACKKAEAETLKRARDDSVCTKRKRFSLSFQKNESSASAKKAKIYKDSSKREPRRRNEGLRKPSLKQVAPNSSTGKQPLDPAVESAYCGKTSSLEKSVECFSSKRVLSLDSAVELVSSENTLPLGPPVHSITQEKPPLHIPVELSKARFSEKRGDNEEKTTSHLESAVPLESAVKLVFSKNTLPPDPTFHSITQEKPPLEPPSDPTFYFIIQEKSPLHTLIEPAEAPLSEKRGANEKSTNLPRKKVTFDLKVKTYEQVGERYYSSDNEIEEETVPKSRLLLSPTCVTFPSNHRYQNCDNYGEIEELEGEEEEDYYFSDDEEVKELDELDGVGFDEIGIRIEGNEECKSFVPLSADKETELSPHSRSKPVCVPCFEPSGEYTSVETSKGQPFREGNKKRQSNEYQPLQRK